MGLISQLTDYENELVREFHRHPFFLKFSSLTDAELKRYLVQKWFLSDDFVHWYDRAMNGMSDPEAKNVAKKIMLDETPPDKTTHREDLIADLEYIGVPKAAVLTAKPTKHTLRAINKLHDLVAYSGEQDYDLKTLEKLRMAGEILVGEEYRHVVPELKKRFGLEPEQSRFYAPHLEHDEPGGSAEGIDSHSDEFLGVLGRLVSDEYKMGVAKRSAREAYEARVSFFGQFTTRYRALHAAKQIGKIAAGTLLAAYLANTAGDRIRYSEHEKYARFLVSLSPAEKVFYLESEQWLLDRFKETNDTRYLKNIGTFRAVDDVWGLGP